MIRQVVVFLDAHNVYKGAREAFHYPGCSSTDGQVSPLALAKQITAQVPDGELKQVRVYRGLPSNKHDPVGYAASRRQTAAWMKEDPQRVYVYLRSLQYLPGLPPREKGIDVQLAIDFVTLAVAGQYDVGVLFSTDTDLAPALDAVYELHGHGLPWPRVAAWRGPNFRQRRIGASGKHRVVPCCWIDRQTYQAIQDHTHYR